MKSGRSWIWAFVLITLLLPLNFYLLFHLGFGIRVSLLIKPFLIEYGLTIATALPFYLSQRYMVRTGDRRPLYMTIYAFLLVLLLLYLHVAGEIGLIKAKDLIGVSVCSIAIIVIPALSVLLRGRP